MAQLIYVFVPLFENVVAMKTNYLFRRPGSQNWYLKLQYTGDLAERMGRRRIEKSLGTPNRAEAEIRALPLIEQHKLALFEEQRARDFPIRATHKLEPGREHQGASGERVCMAPPFLTLTKMTDCLAVEPRSFRDGIQTAIENWRLSGALT